MRSRGCQNRIETPPLGVFDSGFPKYSSPTDQDFKGVRRLESSLDTSVSEVYQQ